MQNPSQPTTDADARSVPIPGGRFRAYPRIERMITDWRTTPGKLWAIMVVLVCGILFSGGVGAYAADARVQTVRDITEHIEPLDDHVTTLYRSLAAADAEITSGFLDSGLETTSARARYDGHLAEATERLAKAGAQADEDVVSADRIADIAARLPVYTGLVERALANNRQGLPVGVAYLRRASQLMQNSILPEAEELQRRQAARLADAYDRADAVPVLALTAGTVSLAGLISAQILLFRRTHRVFNIGLVAATGAVLAGLLWWTVTGTISAGHLQYSRGHVQSVSGALGPAQTFALQARAIESLALLTRSGFAEEDFTAQMQLLARQEGTGGALGAAQSFSTDPHGRDLVDSAVRAAVQYQKTHDKVRQLDERGQYDKAVEIARSEHSPRFDDLGSALSEAIEYKRAAFTRDIARAQGWLSGLAIGTGALTLASSTGVILGIRQRLEEYR